MRGRLQASSCWMLRSGVRSGQRKRSPPAAFLDALSRLVGRWLLVRSDAPEMDAVTVLCKARGYIARPGGRMEEVNQEFASALRVVLVIVVILFVALHIARGRRPPD